MKPEKLNNKIRGNGVIYFFVLVLATACSITEEKKPEFILNAAYTGIDKIVAKANCESPRGPYQVEVSSFADGSCYFNQIIEGEATFPIRVSADMVGLMYNENEEVLDTLSMVMVEMIRGHQFHKIQALPNKLFGEIEFLETAKNGEHLFQGMDRYNRPVKLYVDPDKLRLKSTEMINPRDTSEIIEVVHKAWFKTEYGDITKEIEIIQAKEDTFFYDFYRIEINDEVILNEG